MPPNSHFNNQGHGPPRYPPADRPMVAPVYMTVSEAATYCRVSESMVYEWVRLGKLPAFRPSTRGGRGKVLVTVGDLNALMESFRIDARDAGIVNDKHETLRFLR